MRLGQLLGPILLIAGLGLLALALTRGEATVYLVVIVPVVTGSGPLALLGILFIFAGFFTLTLFWPWSLAAAQTQEGLQPIDAQPAALAPARRWGGVVFLGPLPIVFGSDSRMTRLMLLVGVVLFFALLALTLLALLA
ncbi:MAG TPA: DUF131 domain-containing protein [Thermoplasmata archaeon]|nr:DUF131 domain-containing protein [Thermoplasmata archaeon]